MTFGFDICTYLLENHAKWDSASVPNGFNLNVNQLNTPELFNVSGILYLNQIPDDRSDCISVYDTGGYSPEHTYESRSVLDKPAAQVRVRNSSLKVAEHTADALFVLLDEVCFQNVNRHCYLRISCTSPPAYTGKDQVTTDATAYEFTLNLTAMMRR